MRVLRPFVRRALLAGIVLCALQGVATAQMISAELPGPRPAAQPDPWQQRSPVVVMGPGGAHLALTFTGRAFPTNTTSILAGTRFAADGTILDQVALELGPPGFGYRAMVEDYFLRIAAASTGTGYLVGMAAGDNVRLRTIPTSGAPGAEFMVSAGTAAGAHRWPSIACSPTDCLLAFWTFSNTPGHKVWAVRITGEAAGTPFLVTTAAGDQHEPAVAWDGTNYLVAWRDIRRPDGGDVYAARVGATGVLEPNGILISDGPGTEEEIAVSVGSGGTLILWRDNRLMNGTAEIWGARLDSAGTVVGAPRAYATTTGALGPAVSWNGSDHLVAWADATGGQGARMLRIAGDGTPDVAGASSLSATALSRPEVAGGAAKHLVVWTQAGALPAEATAYLRRLPAGGSAGPDIAFAGITSAEAEPGLASNGSEYFVVWTDTRHGWKTIYGSRMTLDGVFLDGSGIRLSPLGANIDRFGASIHWGDGSYLVAWQSRPSFGNMTIDAARISPEGQLLDATPIPLSPSVFHADSPRLALAWNGLSWLVVWKGFDHVEGARVSGQGALLDQIPRRISRSTSNSVRDPIVAWSGQVHLVAWTDGRMGYSRTFGARLAPDASHLDSADVSLGEGANRGDLDPSLASNGNELLLLYIEPRSADDGKLRARRLDTQGRPIDPVIEVTGIFEDTLRGRVVWDGENWFATYIQRHPQSSDEYLRAVRISPWGTVLYPFAEVSMRSSFFPRPQLMGAGNGRSAMAWTRAVASTVFNNRAYVGETIFAVANCPTGACVGPPAPDGGVTLMADGGVTGDAGQPDAGRRGGGGGGCEVAAGQQAAGAWALVVLSLLGALAAGRARRTAGRRR